MSVSDVRMVEDAHLAKFYAKKQVTIVRGKGDARL